MKLNFNAQIIDVYSSSSQKIRVLTEDWVNRQVYCPGCGNDQLNKYSNNRPVADFFCAECKEEFELKSKKGLFGRKIVDGAYQTMLERLTDYNNPNFFFLNYEQSSLRVVNFFVIPKHFFVPNIIEKRKPLASNARRAGWIGCNILLDSIPKVGRIYFVRNCEVEPKGRVLSEWRRALFLRESKAPESRGWVLEVMKCIDRLQKQEFSLADIYSFEKELKVIYPNNKHIKDKIRQQLQILRDKGYLEFKGRGKYRVPMLDDKVISSQMKQDVRPSQEESSFIDQIEREINEKLKFSEYLPVYSLAAACGRFGEGQEVAPLGWMKTKIKKEFNQNMFIIKAVGSSMEPRINDDSFCVFQGNVVGSRNGKIVLVELRRDADPDTGRYTIKRYSSTKKFDSDGQWRHDEIILEPLNSAFEKIVLKDEQEGELKVIAEFVDVLN